MIERSLELARRRHRAHESRYAPAGSPDMLAYMNRTTVKLPFELDARLRHEAARRNITISELTREAIEHHLGPRRRLGAAAAGRSGCSDISERIEEILASEVPASR